MRIVAALPLAMLLIAPSPLSSQPKNHPKAAGKGVNKQTKQIIQSLKDDAMDYITLNYDFNPELVIQIGDWQEKANRGQFPKGTSIKLELAKILFGPHATAELFDEKILDMRKSMEFLQKKPSNSK